MKYMEQGSERLKVNVDELLTCLLWRQGDQQLLHADTAATA